MKPVSVRYRRSWRNARLLLVSVFCALLLTAVTIAALVDRGLDESTVSIALFCLLLIATWWLVWRSARDFRAFRRAIAEGRPALVADETGLTFFHPFGSPHGRTGHLSWSEISGVHLHREGKVDMLSLEGSYEGSASGPIRFNLADLEADGPTLLRDLARIGDRPAVEGASSERRLVQP